MSDPAPPEVRQQDGVTIVEFGPDWDNLYENMLDVVTDSLLKIGDEAEPPRVIIDMPHTKFFGSAYLGLLLRVSNRLKMRGAGCFGLSRLTPYCKAIIEKTQLDEIWQTFETVDEAVAALNAN